MPLFQLRAVCRKPLRLHAAPPPGGLQVYWRSISQAGCYKILQTVSLAVETCIRSPETLPHYHISAASCPIEATNHPLEAKEESSVPQNFQTGDFF